MVWQDECQLFMALGVEHFHAALHSLPLVHQYPLYIGEVQVAIGNHHRNL